MKTRNEIIKQDIENELKANLEFKEKFEKYMELYDANITKENPTTEFYLYITNKIYELEDELEDLK